MFNLKDFIKDVPNYPKEGILFKDITPLLQNADAFQYTVAKLADFAIISGADIIVAPEARGFLFGCPTAVLAHLPFAPVRKPGKLPRQVIEASYELEYGTDKLQMHLDAVKPGMKVAIVDDLLATGGTMDAMVRMIEALGAEVVAIECVIELVDLEGRKRFRDDINFCSLIRY